MADRRRLEVASTHLDPKVELAAKGPYDMERSLARVVCAVVASRHPTRGPREQLLETGEFPLALRLEGSPVLVGLSQDERDGPVCARMLQGKAELAGSQALDNEIRRVLCLDHDLDAFAAVAARDPVLTRLEQRFRGLRIVLTSTPFEGLCRSIVFQQISYMAAESVERRFQERFGERIVHGDREFWLSPTPAQVAALSDDALRSVGIPVRKGLAMLTIAREIVQGRLELAALAQEPDADEATRKLTRHFGIGPWTAHHALIRAIGALDCLPHEDPGLRAAVTEYYRLHGRASAEDVIRIGELWRPFRSYASYYFWNTFWEPPQTLDLPIS